MGNTLGEAGLILYADTARLQSDMGKASYLVQKNMEQMQVRAVAIGTVIGEALSKGFEVLEKVAEIIPETIEHMDRLAKAAEKVGLPTDEFTKLNYAAGLADVSMEQLEKSMGFLTKSQAAALKTTSEQAKIFDALGISIKNADGSLKNSSDVLRQFADRFVALKGSPEIMAAGFKLFGRSFQELIPLLQEGSEGLQKAGDEAAALGIVLDEKTAKAATAAEDDFKRLHTAVDGLWQRVAAQLMPQLNELLVWALDFVKDGGNAAEIAREIGDGFGTMVAAGKDLAVVVGWLGQIKQELSDIEGVQNKLNENGGDRGWIGNFLQQHAPGLYKPLLGSGNEQGAHFGNVAGDATTVANVGKDFQSVTGQSDTVSANQSKYLAALQAIFAGTDKATKANKAHAASVDNTTAAYDRFTDLLGRLQGELDGPLARAEAQHNKAVRELNELAVKGKVSHADLVHALEIEAKAYAKVRDEINRRYESEIAALSGPVAREENEHADRLHEIDTIAKEYGLTTERLSGLLAEEAKQHRIAGIEAKRQADPLATMLQDMKLEADQIGSTNAQRAVMNELMREGISLYSAEGQAALAQASTYERLADERQKNVQLMDTFRTDLADLGVTALYNFGEVGKSFKKMMDDIAQQISRRIIENWINGLFGQQGTMGQGTGGGNWLSGLLGGLFGNGSANSYTDNAGFGANDGSFNTGGASSGGFWSSVVSWAAGLFGGGHANGGPVNAGKFYEVGEFNRPELLNVRGKSYLIPGNEGNVSPMSGGGLTQINNFNYAAPYDARTEAQKNARLGFETNRVLKRNS